MGIIIEHFAGTFPLWLAPEQVRIIPVGEAFFAYADEVFEKIKTAGIRVKFDDSTDSLGKRFEMQKWNIATIYSLLVNKRKILGHLQFETSKQRNKQVKRLVPFITKIQEEINTKAL